MKIRNSFVSNSSSSSFVLIGYDVTGLKLPDNINSSYTICEGVEEGLKDGQVVIGDLYTWEESDCDNGMSVTPNEEQLFNIKVDLNLHPSLQWKIFFGTRVS